MAQRQKTELTPHEKRVLSLLLDGKSNGEIAQVTKTAKPAVAQAVWRICVFYGVHGERQLFKLLIKSQIIHEYAQSS